MKIADLLTENILQLDEAWSAKYKRSIDCSNPKGFSQRAHCQGRKKHNEAVEDMVEVLDEAVGGNYLYHARSAYDAKDVLASGYIPKASGPQKATQAQTKMPTVSLTRDWRYASDASQTQSQMAGIGRDVVFVLDRSAIESNFKTLGTSQNTNIKGLAYNPYLMKNGEARSQNTDAIARANAKGKAKYAEPTAKAGGEFEEAVIVPKGALPLKGTMIGFWVNPKSELMKDPIIMNDPRRLDMVRPNQFVKAKQTQDVAEGQLNEFAPNDGDDSDQQPLKSFKEIATIIKTTLGAGWAVEHFRHPEKPEYIFMPVDETRHKTKNGMAKIWSTFDPDQGENPVYWSSVYRDVYDGRGNKINRGEQAEVKKLKTVTNALATARRIQDHYQRVSKLQEDNSQLSEGFKQQGVSKNLNEFAPAGNNGDDGGFDGEEILRKLAAQWWNGNEQQMARAQRTLASMGWDIGEDDHYDDGGVFVIRIGDEDGHSYISWSHDDLQSDDLSEDSMSLRDWFGKGKHGGAGGGGWDRYNTKGERIGKCGERKPGEGKPKCLSKAKAASLRASGGKKAIASAVNRKRREDPNPNRKGNADMVSNATRKKSNESIERGHYVHAVDGRDDAHEYLNKIRDCLEHSESSLSESAPKWQDHQTPQQRVGIKNWHEIDRAYRQVNTKNPGDSLRLANLKFFSEDPRTLTRDEVESVWNFLKAFFRDQKNQRNQLQVYDALSTNRGIEQILAMSRATVTEESDKFQQFIPSSTRWLVAYIPAGKRDPEYSYYNDDEEAALAADKLKLSGHKIIGIPVEVSKRTVQEGGKSRPLTIDDLKVYNLVVRPSEIQQRNPMFVATEKKWNSIGFRWTDNLRCYWMNKKQLLDPKKRKEVERFLGRSLNPDELPPMYIHKSQVPVSRRLGTYKD